MSSTFGLRGCSIVATVRPRARERLLNGTGSACERHGGPEKFDAAMTARWSDAVAEAIVTNGAGSSATAFLRDHPISCGAICLDNHAEGVPLALDQRAAAPTPRGPSPSSAGEAR